MVGGVVEGVAFGGDPRHFGRFLEQRLVVFQTRRRVLAGKAARQQADQFGAIRHGQQAVAFQLPQQCLGARGQRVGGRFGHAGHGGAEGVAVALALRVELAQEELGNLLGGVGMGVGAAGHADAVERVGTVQHVAERAQDAREGRLAFGQRAALPLHRAQCAMVEGDLAAGAGHVVGVGAAGGHAVQDVAEQHDIERLGDLGTRGAALDIGRQPFGHGDQGQQVGGTGGAQVGVEQLGDIRIHGNVVTVRLRRSIAAAPGGSQATNAHNVVRRAHDVRLAILSPCRPQVAPTCCRPRPP
ncbi:hypothetical protein D3C72_1190430 [compost metagenome]